MALLTQHTVDGEGLQFLQGSNPTSSVVGQLRANTTLTGSRTWTLPDKTGTIAVQDIGFAMRPTDATARVVDVVEADDILVVPVAANSIYICFISAKWDDGAGSAGFEWGFVGPDGCTVSNPDYGVDEDVSGAGAAMANSGSGTGIIMATFQVKTVSAGTFAFAWAQKTLDAVNGVTLKAESLIELRKVS